MLIFNVHPDDLLWSTEEGQTIVNFRIEGLRLLALWAFEEEERLRQKVTAGTRPRVPFEERRIAMRLSATSKEAFWGACESAKQFGYRVPSKIHESAIKEETGVP